MTPAEALARLAAATTTRVSVRRPAAGLVQMEGRGRVTAVAPGTNRVDLVEEGTWSGSGDGGGPVAYTDALRIRVSADGALLTVEETRRGADRPVLLAEAESGRDGLVSRTDMVCGADRYSLRVRPMSGGLVLEWTVQGPRKDEQVTRSYLAEPEAAG